MKVTERGRFSISVGNFRTTEELLVAAGFDKVNEYINQINFPLSGEKGSSEIELLEIDHHCEISPKEVLEEFARRGLERPTHEHAIEFGRQHPQIKDFMFFPHNPWRGPGYLSGGSVITLSSGGGIRTLELISMSHGWIPGNVFAGVRPRK